VRPYAKGQKNDFNDAEAIAEAVQRPTMKFVAVKTTDQLDLQALHRVRERLVSQPTGPTSSELWQRHPVTSQLRLKLWSPASAGCLVIAGPRGCHAWNCQFRS
jgi:hypothetical protein